MSAASEAAASPQDTDVFFDARLTPYRSLGPEGFRLFMIAVALLSFVVGLSFSLLGAWPVFGFCGLDVLLIYLAFRASYRSARAYEEVKLTASALTVKRVSERGAECSWTFEPAWLRVDLDDPPEHGSMLTVGSHGRNLAIGQFLTPEERGTLAAALRRALNARRDALIARPA